MASGKARWLAVVGIGESGIAGLADEAKQAIAAADHVFGGTRHLELAQDVIRGLPQAWPSPFSVEPVLELRGKKVCVLASGDPFLFGVGATLAASVPPEEMLVLPAPSAFSLAAARLGWPLQAVDCLSLHGRAIDLLRPHLHAGRRILALTSDADAPRLIAGLLAASGFGPTRLTVLEALGGPAERIRTASASGFDLEDVNPLNLLALEVESEPQARILPLGFGLPDTLFENDGQLTKREVRAITLASLAPRRGELLWDIGAGSGSIGIEWMLADPSMRAIAVEPDPTRAARARLNAAACGVPGLIVKDGAAPEALAGLPPPDAIFIGGGGSSDGIIETATEALKPGGRLVANAVTTEMESVLVQLHGERGGSLTRIAISRSEAVGSKHAFRPALPITQWTWVKQ